MKDVDNYSEGIAKDVARMIEEEGLIIDEIEYYTTPDPKRCKGYFSEECLRNTILESTNKVRQDNGLEPIDLKIDTKKSGYMALHLDVNLEKEGRRLQNTGYHGELQLIGADVAMLKEVEDFSYKLLNGDSIASKDMAYSSYENIYLDVINNPNKYLLRDYKNAQKRNKNAKKPTEITKEELLEYLKIYTKEAYIMQRNRNGKTGKLNDNTTNWMYKYPTIEQCGLKDKIPSILDFNVLARLKRTSDDQSRVLKDPNIVYDDIKEK